MFYQQVNYIAANKEILFENVFIDGNKIDQNTNNYTFQKKVVCKNKEKMFNKILTLVKNIKLKEFILQKELIINDIGKAQVAFAINKE